MVGSSSSDAHETRVSAETRAAVRGKIFFWVAVAAAIIVGVVHRAPVLQGGFHTDDAVQVAMVRGEFPVHRSIFDLFRFADGERDGLEVIESGYHPWWAQPDLRIAMFRPLASALIAVDHHLFGSEAFFPHLHSMLWWVAMVLAAALVFGKVLTPKTAALAVFLFCIHSSHSVPVAWLANRSTLIATTFGLLGLLCHLQRRERPSKRLLVLEYAAFSLSVLGGEYALPTLAYVLAVEFVDRSRSGLQNLKDVLPALIPAALFAVVRTALGFGIRGSGYYVSPLESPRAYFHDAILRIPVLCADLLVQVPAVYWVFGSPWFEFEDTRRFLIGLGLAAVALLILAVYLVNRFLPVQGRSLRWLTAGALMAVVPGATALPENRVLVAASFGIAGVFAILLAAGLRSMGALIRARRYPLLLAPIVLVGIIVYGHVYETWVRSKEHLDSFLAAAELQRDWALRAEIPDDGAERRRVVIVSGADFTTIANLPWVRRAYGRPLVKSYTRLSGALQVHEINRTAPNVIELSVLSNELENTMAGSLYRSAKRGFRIGDKIRLEDMLVEVLGVEGKTPWLTRFTFARSLDDPDYLFLESTKDGIKPFKLPPVGQKLRIAIPERPHY